jgi:hypothetical protein
MAFGTDFSLYVEYLFTVCIDVLLLGLHWVN